MCIDTAGHASSSHRRGRLADSMAPHTCPRPFPAPHVRRGPRSFAACDDLPPFNERTGKVVGSLEEAWVRKGRRRGERPPKGQGQRQRQRQDERKGQVSERELSSEHLFDGHVRHVFPAVQCLEDSWGSFGRFRKLLKSSCLHERSEPRTPPKFAKGDSLFPSLLVIPECTGKSKGARSRRARRRGRDVAWRHAEILWAYFTFLNAGSPHKTTEQHRLLQKAVDARWTSLRKSYAGCLHAEIHRFVRLQSSQIPFSRGILKLNEFIKVVRNSTYTSNLAVDQLTRVAKNVKPDRMSLPTTAGVVDPRNFLKGAHLEAFNRMAEVVPHDVEPLHPTVGCYKVEPSDVLAVNRKLLASGVATLIPEQLAMRDSQGSVITGGLFAVDH